MPLLGCTGALDGAVDGSDETDTTDMVDTEVDTHTEDTDPVGMTCPPDGVVVATDVVPLGGAAGPEPGAWRPPR